LINAASAAVFSVDIPSGIDGSTGCVCGRAVRADLTVTFAQAKIGHGSQPGAEYCGRLEVVDIGIPFMDRVDFASLTRLIDHGEAVTLLPERPATGHKGTFGHALIIAGAPGKSGAAALAGSSAGRSGCGLVTVATPASVHDIIEVKLTEVMSAALVTDAHGLIGGRATEQLPELIAGRQVVAVGPGLGQSTELGDVLEWLLSFVQVPMVIDADGLNLLAQRPELLTRTLRPPLILTPHPGEMARLSGLSVAEIQSRRYEIAREFAVKNRVVLLLKGTRTIIAAPDGRVNINSSGCDALASGGSGDVLTGLIAGLVAQGLDCFAAATLGAWLHGRSAEFAAQLHGKVGVIASDLISCLPQSRHELAKGGSIC
jgi:NAD(P)H-hydrate epimerase